MTDSDKPVRGDADELEQARHFLQEAHQVLDQHGTPRRVPGSPIDASIAARIAAALDWCSRSGIRGTDGQQIGRACAICGQEERTAEAGGRSVDVRTYGVDVR